MPKKVQLIGIDPGIVDTGVVWVVIDEEKKELTITYKVWRAVTTKIKGGIKVSERFLVTLQNDVAASMTRVEDTTVFIEGYRNRGRNPGQDQKMTTLVQAIHQALDGSKVVDNTGVKNVVTDMTLQLLNLYWWEQATHHADLRSAARIALKGAYQDDRLNVKVANVVRDELEGTPWTSTNSQAS